MAARFFRLQVLHSVSLVVSGERFAAGAGADR